MHRFPGSVMSTQAWGTSIPETHAAFLSDPHLTMNRRYGWLAILFLAVLGASLAANAGNDAIARQQREAAAPTPSWVDTGYSCSPYNDDGPSWFAEYRPCPNGKPPFTVVPGYVCPPGTSLYTTNQGYVSHCTMPAKP
jgi:hypothetical protein